MDRSFRFFSVSIDCITNKCMIHMISGGIFFTSRSWFISFFALVEVEQTALLRGFQDFAYIAFSSFRQHAQKVLVPCFARIISTVRWLSYPLSYQSFIAPGAPPKS